MELDVRPLPRTIVTDDVETLVDPDGGAALRCCLRESRPGEELVLARVTPPGPAGPYAEAGPVFLHRADCDGPSSPGYPDDFRGRTQVFRAYSPEGRIVGGLVVEPDDDPESAARDLLADEGVEFVHSRNVVYGCYMVAIHRQR